MKALILIAMIFVPYSSVWADDAVYVTDDGDVTLGIITNNMYLMKPDKLEAAKHLTECRPAEEFPNGNWGPVVSGYQLSLRFDKPSYTNGEPIVATLLMRNVTNTFVYLHYSLFPAGDGDGPIGFAVVSNSGGMLTQHEYPAGSFSGSFKWLLPGTQAKYSERLDKRFDLTNGTYIVQAVKSAWVVPWPEVQANHKPVFKWALQREVKVESAEVKITIADGH